MSGLLNFPFIITAESTVLSFIVYILYCACLRPEQVLKRLVTTQAVCWKSKTLPCDCNGGVQVQPVYVSGGADTRELHHRDAADNTAHPCSHKRGEQLRDTKGLLE